MLILVGFRNTHVQKSCGTLGERALNLSSAEHGGVCVSPSRVTPQTSCTRLHDELDMRVLLQGLVAARHVYGWALRALVEMFMR